MKGGKECILEIIDRDELGIGIDLCVELIVDPAVDDIFIHFSGKLEVRSLHLGFGFDHFYYKPK